ncbi:hypothetical protein TBK1r_54470 [Stieleria magnilauensis]|uniref:Uncharacterized protein n=1 Tax=Stieleria magnilauensis TaxID=2527963 RepID=A0ABX5XWN6_9BACT|nr:hypothetical protein TBK1r_54470 [Planctomycetes bacterium TBK1r]
MALACRSRLGGGERLVKKCVGQKMGWSKNGLVTTGFVEVSYFLTHQFFDPSSLHTDPVCATPESPGRFPSK